MAKRLFVTTHGMSRTRTYAVWEAMIQRCTNPNWKTWNRYGGRGITVCDRWKSFENFYADMGERPQGLTLERRDNDRGYCPENCCWVTQAEQNRNHSRNVMLTHEGVTLCMTDWAERLGIHYTTLAARLRNGWSIADAVTAPSRGRGYRRFSRKDSNAPLSR